MFEPLEPRQLLAVLTADFNNLAAGDLPGQDSGAGWGAWSGSTDIDLIAGDLVAPAATNYHVKTAGTPLSVKGPSSSNQTVATSTLDAPLTANEIWFSFLVNPQSTGSPWARGGINLNSSSPRILAVESNLRLIGGGGDVAVPGQFVAGQTALVLGRMTVSDTGDDTVQVWVNPDVSLGVAGLGAAAGTLTRPLVGAAGITSVAIESYGVNGQGIVDQVVIGDDAAEFFGTIDASDSYFNMVRRAAPVGYWRLNETSGLAVNQGTAGAILNGTYTNFPTGLRGAGGLLTGDPDPAADFNGLQNASGSYVAGGGLDSVTGGNPFENDWTIETWFVRDSLNQWSAIFSNNYDNAAPDDGRLGPLTTFIDTSHRLGINGAGATPNNVSVDLGAGSLGQKVYAVITKTGGNAAGTAYLTVHANVGGSWLTSVTGTNVGWNLQSNDGFYIGRHWTGGTQNHDGVIDEVAIYNRVLTLSEIKAHYAVGAAAAGVVDPGVIDYRTAVRNTNPVGYWRLNESSGPAVNQGSGGATLNGTYTNFAAGSQGVAGLIAGDPDAAADFNGLQNASGSHVAGGGLDSVTGGNPFENDWTIETWFVRDSLNPWSAIFSNNYDNAAPDNGQVGPLATFIDTSHRLGINGAGVTANNVSVDLGAGSLGQKVYAVITKTGGNAAGTAYLTVHANVGGRWLTSVTGTNVGWNLQANDGFYIGRHFTGGTQNHDGKIDEVAIYNRSLTLSEIKAHYAVGAAAEGVADPGIIDYRTAVRNTNPVGYWRLDESSGPAANQGSGGTTLNGTYTNFAAGSQGVAGLIAGDPDAAADFNGSSSYVTGTGLNTIAGGNPFASDWTIETWLVRDTANADWTGVFSNNNGGTNAPILTFFNNADGNTRHRLGMNPSGSSATPDIYVNLDQYGGGGAAYLGKPVYAVMTYNAVPKQLNMYVNVNGTWLPQATTTLTRTNLNTAAPGFHIGRHYDGGMQIHDGKIDEVAIYNRALTEAEVQAHFAVGSGAADGARTDEDTIVTALEGKGLLAADNAAGVNSLAITAVNGNPANIGSPLTLASGADPHRPGRRQLPLRSDRLGNPPGPRRRPDPRRYLRLFDRLSAGRENRSPRIGLGRFGRALAGRHRRNGVRQQRQRAGPTSLRWPGRTTPRKPTAGCSPRSWRAV